MVENNIIQGGHDDLKDIVLAKEKQNNCIIIVYSYLRLNSNTLLSIIQQLFLSCKYKFKQIVHSIMVLLQINWD